MTFRYRPPRHIPGIDFTDSPSLTDPSQAQACDINHIIRKHDKYGVITHLNRTPPRYADVTNIPDYATAINIVREAESHFNALPSAIRARFNNSPQEMLVFVSNADNRAEALALGLIDPPQPIPIDPSIPPKEPT